MIIKQEARPEGRYPLAAQDRWNHGSGARTARLAVFRQSSRPARLAQRERSGPPETRMLGSVLRKGSARLPAGPGPFAKALRVLPPGRAGPPRSGRVSGGVRDASPRARKRGQAGCTAIRTLTCRTSRGNPLDGRTRRGSTPSRHGSGYLWLGCEDNKACRVRTVKSGVPGVRRDEDGRRVATGPLRNMSVRALVDQCDLCTTSSEVNADNTKVLKPHLECQEHSHLRETRS